MELAKFEELGVQRNSVVEYTRGSDPEQGKVTRPVYFLELVKELPPEYRKGRETPPFIEIAREKDKNGIPRDRDEIPLEDILSLTVTGQSNLRM